jgi:hypothetical protein
MTSVKNEEDGSEEGKKNCRQSKLAGSSELLTGGWPRDYKETGDRSG